MKLNLKSALAFLWSRPDPVLAQAGIAGELFVAKIRFAPDRTYSSHPRH